MFYSITGTVVFFDSQFVAVNCGGVAFKCATTMNTLKKIAKTGELVTVYTYLNVREDALDLFGFADEKELECFKLLIGVSGVGPKAALAILSALTPDKLAVSIASGDAKAISAAQGVGAKLAQRVIMELKDKLAAGLYSEAFSADVSSVSSVAERENTAEAVSALTMLGYSQSDAATAVSKLDNTETVENLIKDALKLLAKQV